MEPVMEEEVATLAKKKKASVIGKKGKKKIVAEEEDPLLIDDDESLSEGEKEENRGILAELNAESEEEEGDTSEESGKEETEWDDHTDIEIEPNPNLTPITPLAEPTPNTLTSNEPNPETTHTSPTHTTTSPKVHSPQPTINQPTIIQPQPVPQDTDISQDQPHKDPDPIPETPQQNPEQALVDVAATFAAATETDEAIMSHSTTSVKKGRRKMMARKRKFQKVKEEETKEGVGLSAEEEIQVEKVVAEAIAVKEDVAAHDATTMTEKEKAVAAAKVALELVAAFVLKLKEPSPGAGSAFADTGPVL